MTHKERIKKNLERFDSGEWNKFTYSHDFECTINYVEGILNEVLEERLNRHRWELRASGVPLDKHYFIEDAEIKEIAPQSITEIGNNKVVVIYKSKMNENEL